MAWSDGDKEAIEKLTPLVQAELHRLARRYMAKEGRGHTLQTTALVNEAYLRLIDWKNVRWQNRAHFKSSSAMFRFSGNNGASATQRCDWFEVALEYWAS